MGAADEILKARGASAVSVKAVVAIDSEIDRELVEALTSDEGVVSVLDYLDFERDPLAKAAGGDVLLVVCSEYTPEAGQFVRAAREDDPMRPVILACPSS